MICPHCDRDTPAMNRYCRLCGGSLDLTFDKVQDSFADEEREATVRRADYHARTLLLTGATVFLLVCFARLALLRPTWSDVVEPSYELSQPSMDAVEALPLELPPVVIPEDS